MQGTFKDLKCENGDKPKEEELAPKGGNALSSGVFRLCRDAIVIRTILLREKNVVIPQ